MIFEIKKGLFVDSDAIRSIRYFQSDTPAFKNMPNNWFVEVNIEGSESFSDTRLTEEEAKAMCLAYVEAWRAAKEQRCNLES